MARTNSTLVQEILGSNYGKLSDGSDPSLQPYIDMASALTDRVAACAAARNRTLTTTELELIERWMSAHYYTQMDPLYKSRSTASASGSFADQSYKEAAIDLDSSGCLASLMKRQRASMGWAGKTESEQLSYEDRN